MFGASGVEVEVAAVAPEGFGEAEERTVLVLFSPSVVTCSSEDADHEKVGAKASAKSAPFAAATSFFTLV